jgi:hypothetical protein
MTTIHARIHVSSDGKITGQAPPGLPAGEHDAAIDIGSQGKLDLASVTPQVRAIQDRIARLPVLDTRSDDEILGYTASGTFG